MSKTAIEWTDETWNPTTGCTLISPGCANCYAKSLHDMRHKAYKAGKFVPLQYATPFEKLKLHPERLDLIPTGGRTRRVFVNSMSDLFHEDVPDEFLDRVFAAMALRPQHTFQILTKRPAAMRAYINEVDIESERETCARFLKAIPDFGSRLKGDLVWPLPNVWLGVSVENQKCADERIPLLLETPAAVRFLSCEPLLGAVDISRWLFQFKSCSDCPCPDPEKDRSRIEDCCRDPEQIPSPIHWVIVGGESGARARPMHPDWARSIRDQCQAAGVAFFFKQWGEFVPKSHTGIEVWPPWTGDEMERVGAAKAGRLLDGREWNEFPEVRA